MKPGYGAVVLTAAVLVSIGCRKEAAVSEERADAEAPAAAPTAAAKDPAAEARQYFKTKCVVCHGESGKGDGPGAAALVPKPRDYTNAEWQRSVTDEQLKKTILLGGAAVGKSPGMPANPDLRNKPELLDELVKVIRGFGS